MGGKRSYTDAIGGESATDDRRPDKMKLSRKDLSGTALDVPQAAPPIVPSDSADESSEGEWEPPRKVAKAAAKEWLSAQLGVLKQLTDNPDLFRACASIAGASLIRRAAELGTALGAALVEADALPAAPGTPLASEEHPAPVDKEGRPALPKVHDAEMERVAFVHKGSLGEVRATGGAAQPRASVHEDYERLEFYGDSVLGLMATRLLVRWFPDDEVGRLAFLRERMVRNETLARLSLTYHFDDRVVLGSYNRSGRNMRGASKPAMSSIKMLGDVFEAYIGAVVQSRPADGFEAAERFMAALWRPLVLAQEIPRYDKRTKHDLAKKLMGKGIKVAYNEVAKPQPAPHGRQIFSIGIFLTGWGWSNQLLGEGKGNSKDEAGWQAASEALKNPLTFQVARVKHEYDRLVKEERERPEGPREAVMQNYEAEFKSESVAE